MLWWSWLACCDVMSGIPAAMTNRVVVRKRSGKIPSGVGILSGMKWDKMSQIYSADTSQSTNVRGEGGRYGVGDRTQTNAQRNGTGSGTKKTPNTEPENSQHKWVFATF